LAKSRNLIPETAAKRYKSIPSSRLIRGFEPIGVTTFAAGSAGRRVRRTGARSQQEAAVMRIVQYVLALVALVATQIPCARAEEVDLLLALAMDVSRSMDQPKFLLQRQGYAAAIGDPQVLSAIRSGPHQKIAVCFIDWSGPFEQRLVIDWKIIDDPSKAAGFGELILNSPRSFYNSTSIGAGINFSMAQIAKAPFEAERHAIDVSGDGTNNAGRDVSFFRDQAVAKGITVNGIVILTDIQFAQNPQHTNPPGGIEKYYRENVIGGPGHFVMVAEDYNSFGRAMVKKLIAEIAGVPPPQRAASASARGPILASSAKLPR
jgi:hypothetical protein